MAHNISFWELPINGNEFPFYFFLYFFGVLGVFIGLIGLGSGMWSIYLISSSLGLFALNIIFYLTHVRRSMSDKQWYLWEAYNQLPSELKASIPLKLDTVKKFDGFECSEYRQNIANLKTNYNELVKERNRFAADISNFRQSLQDVSESTQTDLSLVRETNREIERRM